MCLDGNASATAKFLADNKGKRYVTVYKVLSRYGCYDYTHQKRGYYSFTYDKKWHKGINKSNSRRKHYPIKENKFVNRGIHVYINKEHALDRCYYNYSRVVIELKAALKDLVGIEVDSLGQPKEAVFMQVNVGKKFKEVKE